MSKKLDELFQEYAYSTQQKYQLRLADEKSLDLDMIKNPKYDWEQMREIRLCMEYDIDPSALCDYNIPSDSMEKIRIHLFEKAGIYKQNNENIQRKRLKRFIVCFLLLVTISGVAAIMYVNRDYIMLYFENINFELNCQKVDIGISKIKNIDYTAYIKNYDKKNKLILPNTKINDIGNYTVTYKIKNEVKTKEEHLIVHVYDDIKPIINLSTTSLVVQEGTNISPSKYIVSAIDNIDGDLRKNIKIESNVKVNVPGNYKIVYRVRDTEKNEEEKQIFVTVKENKLTTINNVYPGSSDKKGIKQQNRPIRKTAKDKIFYFETIGDADKIYKQAEKYAKSMIASNKARGYEIKPLKKNSINIGWKVSFV